MEHTVVIHLKPYLKEFITARFTAAELSSRKNIVGIMVQKFITYSPNGSYTPDTNGPTALVISLVAGPGYNPRRGNAYISPKNQKELERLIYHLFKDTFHSYMADRTRYIDQTSEGTIKDCILQFCVDYNLSPESVQYDSLKRDWLRHRRRQEEIEDTKKNFEKRGLNLSLFSPQLFRSPQYEPLYTY